MASGRILGRPLGEVEKSNTVHSSYVNQISFSRNVDTHQPVMVMVLFHPMLGL